MCLHISFVVFLCGPLSMYARANGIHEIDILCWFQVHIHQPKKMLVIFHLYHLRPKLSPCVLHHAHIFCDECVYRCLWPVPQSIDKQYNWILCRHHKTPSQTSLRYAWIYWTNDFCFSSSISLHLKMYCQVLVLRKYLPTAFTFPLLTKHIHLLDVKTMASQ